METVGDGDDRGEGEVEGDGVDGDGRLLNVDGAPLNITGTSTSRGVWAADELEDRNEEVDEDAERGVRNHSDW